MVSFFKKSCIDFGLGFRFQELVMLSLIRVILRDLLHGFFFGVVSLNFQAEGPQDFLMAIMRVL